MQPRRQFSLLLFLLLLDITWTSSASVARFLEKLLSKSARDETTRKGTRSFHPSYKRTPVPLSLISPSASEEIHYESPTREESSKRINEFLPLNPPQNCLKSGGSMAIHSTSTARPSSLHSLPRLCAQIESSASPGTIGVISIRWGPECPGVPLIASCGLSSFVSLYGLVICPVPFCGPFNLCLGALSV